MSHRLGLTRIADSAVETADDEEQITIFTGRVEIVDRATISQALLDRYAAKYAQGFVNIGMTREEHEAAYSEVIRFTPEKVRGW